MLFYAFEFEHWTLGKDEIKVGYLLYSDTGHWNECNSLPCITWLLQECSTFGNYSYSQGDLGNKYGYRDGLSVSVECHFSV